MLVSITLFCLGHLLGLWSPVLIPSSSLLVFGLLLVAALIKLNCPLSRQLVCFFAGVLYVQLSGHWHFNFRPQLNEPKSAQLNVVVSSIVLSQQQNKPLSFIARVSQQNSLYFNSKLKLQWYQPTVLLKRGDRLTIKVSLASISGFENEYGFDYQKWLFAKGIHYQGRITRLINHYRANGSGQWQADQLVNDTQGLPYQGYMLALILAEKQLISKQQFSQLQQLGINHLLAISGLHIGIVFSMLLLLGKCISATGLTCFNKYGQFLFALACTWGFVAVIGFPVSALRAVVLATVIVLLKVTYKHLTLSKVFLLMMVLSLLMQPFSPLLVSWWLSFTAVAAIFFYITCANVNSVTKANTFSWIGLFSRIQQYLGHLLGLQLTISLFLLPVLVFAFAKVYLSGIVINLIAIPYFSFIVIPLSFISALMSFVNSSISTSLWLILDTLIAVFINSASALVDLLPQWQIANDISFVILAMASLLVLFTLGNKVRLWLLSVMVLPLLTSAVAATNSAHPLKVAFLDVGQGTAVLIHRGTKAWLYDLGPLYRSGNSSTNMVIKPTLVGLGIDQLVGVLVSHQDADHKGDLTQLNHWWPSNFSDFCFRSYDLDELDVSVTVLWPNYPINYKNTKRNQLSCVVKIEDRYSGVKILLTGDIDKKQEQQILKSEMSLAAEIMLSPHHGSKYSSSTAFIKAVSPDYVVHSAGVNNRFSFPTEPTQRRYQKSTNATQLATNKYGQVTFVIQRDGNVIQQQQLTWLTPFWKRENPFSFQQEIR